MNNEELEKMLWKKMHWIKSMASDDGMSIELEETVEDLVQFILSREEKQKQLKKREFIRRFCNDHNEEIRWLRGVAIDEEELIKAILALLEE